MTDRQSTHSHDCWSWGPKHYECAMREIERLRDASGEAQGFREEMHELRASIAALAERWMEQQAAYPNSEEGKHAAAAVRLCATELRRLGEGNSAAAQEGL